MKICIKCKLEKSEDSFSKDASSKDTLCYYCKECSAVSNKKWCIKNKDRITSYEKERYKDNPDYYRNQCLKYNYGITPEQYASLWDKQNGKCAICLKEETVIRKGKLRWLSVDHDHSCCPSIKSCGKCIRGLLCQRCNHALGQFKDDLGNLKRAIEYLER